MTTLKGVCPNCGATYYGWGLAKTKHPKCERCNSELDVFDSDNIRDWGNNVDTAEKDEAN